MILIKETFYLIKVGQLYVCGVDGKHLTSRFGMKASNVEVNEVYLTPNLNEALIFDKDNHDDDNSSDNLVAIQNMNTTTMNMNSVPLI